MSMYFNGFLNLYRFAKIRKTSKSDRVVPILSQKGKSFIGHPNLVPDISSTDLRVLRKINGYWTESIRYFAKSTVRKIPVCKSIRSLK